MQPQQVKIHLYKVAWKEFGLSFSQGLKKYVDTFFLTQQFRMAVRDYWDNPLLERGGVMDDMTRQRFYNHLEEEFLNFLVERFDYEPFTTPLPRGNNGELTS